MASAPINDNVRYEPNENPPPLVAIGAGVQAAMIIVAPVVLTVVIVARIAEQPDSYITWGVFAALIVSGVTTVLQAVRVGRVGAGHVLIMGTSGAFIAVCVAALVNGGPATMASLIIVSSLFQFALAYRLSLLRRIFTPVVAGNGHHADNGNGDADRIRLADGCSRWHITGGGPGGCPGYHRRCYCPRAPRSARIAAVVARDSA